VARSWTLTRSSKNDGPDSLGCAVGFVLLMLGGVLFVVLMFILWENATGK